MPADATGVRLAEIAARFGSDAEAETELRTALAMYRARENVAAASRLGG